MSTPKLIVGILIMSMVGDIAWAEGPLRRCRPFRGAGCRCRFHIIGRRGLAYPCPSKSDQNVWIRWKLEVGKPFYEEMTIETKQDMQVMGQKINQDQKVTFFLSWNPVKQGKYGNWTVKQKIEGLRMEIEIAGTKISFDSTQKGARAKPLSDFYKSLVGSEFTLTIDKNMKISKIEGRDEFLKKLVKDNPQVEPLLKTILTDETLKQMSDPAFSVIPGKPVSRGDSWEKIASLGMGPIGSFDTNYKYTYGGLDKNELQKIKVDTTLKYQSPSPNAVSALPFKIVKADLKSKESHGNILFDSAKGRVAKSDMITHLTGTLSIEIGGMASEVTLDQTKTTKIRMTDENPIGQK
jgi:hypothetical protein